MSAGTAGQIVEDALRLITVLDAEESPTETDYTQGVRVLNNLIQHDFGDVLSSFQVERVNFDTVAGAMDFTIGDGSEYDVNVNARQVHNIYYGHLGSTRYELKRKTESYMFSVSVEGPQPTKFMSEVQVDGSLKVYLWPTPSESVPLLLSLGKRVAQITDKDDAVLLPPDAVHALGYILGKRLRPAYGVPISDLQDVLVVADQKEAEWKAFNVKNTAVRLRRRR